MNKKYVGKRPEKPLGKQSYLDLTGEVAVVTGGRGNLGSEFCRALHEHGARVASIDIKPNTLDSSDPSVREFTCDITNKTGVQELFSKIIDAIGTPTILVNCAGLDSPPTKSSETTGLFEDISEETWDSIIDSHLKGAFLVSQEFIRAARRAKQDHGSIINISSIYGVVTPDQSIYDFMRKGGTPFFKPVAYSVAKSGMLNFTRWLAEYGAPHHIRVNTLVLGGVFNNQPKEFIIEYNKRTPLGRMARKDEYNGAILFLASPRASSYVTGSMLVADGGWTAR